MHPILQPSLAGLADPWLSQPRQEQQLLCVLSSRNHARHPQAKSSLLLLSYLAPRLQQQQKFLVQQWVQPLVGSPLQQRCPQRCWTTIGRCPSWARPSYPSWHASFTLASPPSSAEAHSSAGESNLWESLAPMLTLSKTSVTSGARSQTFNY